MQLLAVDFNSMIGKNKVSEGIEWITSATDCINPNQFGLLSSKLPPPIV